PSAHCTVAVKSAAVDRGLPSVKWNRTGLTKFVPLTSVTRTAYKEPFTVEPYVCVPRTLKPPSGLATTRTVLDPSRVALLVPSPQYTVARKSLATRLGSGDRK